MLKKGFIVLGIVGVGVTACIKHEVIPPPVPMVELEAHFFGTVNGTDIEFTEHVVGYEASSNKAKIILPPPNPSSAVYYSQMSSTSLLASIKVGMGSVYWDAATSSDPTLSLFNGFFTANNLPNYSDNAQAGFEVTWRDQGGREWTSTQNSMNMQDVEFTGIVQESDSTGDYSKFICYFDCWVYSLNPDSLALTPPVVHVDSLQIEDATYKGWFRR